MFSGCDFGATYLVIRSVGDSVLYPTDVSTASGRVVPLPLEIENVCPAGRRVHFLDFWLEIDVHRKRIYTSLYDKRKGRPEFEDVANFPNFESRLHMGIKLQCIVSLLVRAARRSSRMSGFVDVASDLLVKFVKHDYPLPPLMLRTRRFLRSKHWPHKLGKPSRALSYIERELRHKGLDP